MKAWERARDLLRNAVPVVLSDEEQDWQDDADAIGSKVNRDFLSALVDWRGPDALRELMMRPDLPKRPPEQLPRHPIVTAREAVDRQRLLPSAWAKRDSQAWDGTQERQGMRHRTQRPGKGATGSTRAPG